MNVISLNGSSFVGKQAHWSKDWDGSVDDLNAYYEPLDTFRAHFQEMLTDIKNMGFDKFDLWTGGQLNWRWATPEHIKIADELLKQSGVEVIGLGDEFGATPDEFASACAMAVGVHTNILSGTVPLLYTDKASVISILKEYGCKLALENHPEKTPAEMRRKLENGQGVLGTTIDTGWYATWGYDVPQSVRDLKDILWHIHVKDVLAGEDHVNVGYGKGIVPVEATLRALKEVGYTGIISVENHPVDHDPTQELIDGLALVKRVMAE